MNFYSADAQTFAEAALAAGTLSPRDPRLPYWFRDFSPARRRQLANRGAAMPGGRYPITNCKDATNARRAIGRTPAAGRSAVMAHIRRREQAVGCTAPKQAMQPGEPRLRAPGSAGLPAGIVSPHDLGTDNTGATSMAEPHAGNQVEPWLTEAHAHSHTHADTGMAHSHPHGHTATDQADHDTTHHSLHHQIANAYTDLSPLPVPLPQDGDVGDVMDQHQQETGHPHKRPSGHAHMHGEGMHAHVHTHEMDAPGHDTPDHQAQHGQVPTQTAEPTPTDVHVPGPGIAPGRPDFPYQPPHGGPLDPLRRVISNLVGGDRRQRVASEREARLFWDDPQRFCQFDATPSSGGMTSDYGLRGRRQDLTGLHAYDDEMWPPPGVDDDEGEGAYPGVYLPDSDIDEDGDNDADDGAQPLFEKADERIQYRDATDPKVSCNTCRFFNRDAGTCWLVEGAIRSTYTCNLQSPRQIDPGVFAEPGEPDHVHIASFAAAEPGRGFIGRRNRRDVADLCAADEPARLFVELTDQQWQRFTETQRLPYLPKPGIYTHPKYGAVVISRERNQRFVENMNNHVYQSRLPLDLEHQTQLSGAAAWITRLELNADGSADAFVEMEPMGSTMLSERRFLYISPQWFDEWTQPHTGATFQDVAIGGALTTRPFFKEEALRSLVASEDGLSIIDRPAPRPKEQQMPDTKPPTQQQAPPVTPPAPSPVQFTEEQARVFAEMQTRLTAAEAQNKSFAEALQLQTKAVQHKAFTDEVLGRSDENGTRWFIDPSLDAEGRPSNDLAGHVAFMEALAEKFGPEAPQLKQYIELNRGHARQMEQSALLRTQGAPGMQTSGVASGGKFAQAMKRFKDADPKITNEQAAAKAFREDPSLYEEYLKANPRQHG